MMPEDRRTGPVVHVMTLGNFANQMFQYIVALNIAQSVPGCRLSNVNLPEWGIVHPPIAAGPGEALRVDGQTIDVAGTAALLRTGVIERLNMAVYGQRMEQLLPVEACRRLFPAHPVAAGDDATLVISIRGGDVLDGHHPDYVLLPIDFYRDLVSQSGLDPLFIGQLSTNPYMDCLRSAFPGARYVESVSPLHDFQFIRSSRHIVPSVSTFAWLAAWLSDAATIDLPLDGFLNPFQARDVDLLPLHDPRYRFHLFPLNYALPVSRYSEAHRPLTRLWRRLPPAMLQDLRDQAPRYALQPTDLLAVFDPDYYAEAHPDVAQSVQAGHFLTPFDHYLQFGLAERRAAFPFDAGFYSRTYPISAVEVGQGDFADLRSHYVSLGRLRGYWPTPHGLPASHGKRS